MNGTTGIVVAFAAGGGLGTDFFATGAGLSCGIATSVNRIIKGVRNLIRRASVVMVNFLMRFALG